MKDEIVELLEEIKSICVGADSPDALENGIYGNALNIDMLEKYYVGLPININARIMSYETDLKYKTIDVKFRQHNTTTNVQI